MIKQDRFILIWMEDLSIKNNIINNDEYTVRHLNLRIDAGEFVCISGLFGIDKISFINTLSCLNRPDGGKYIYNYNDTTTVEKSKLDAVRSEIGFIFKNLNIIDDLTVYQNIEIPTRTSSAAGKSKEIVKAAERLGVSDLLDTKVKRLADIEKHKVSLARALVVNPSLIIADEPADALRQEDAETILNELKEINKLGTAIVCFSQNAQVIEKAQRHIEFEKGCIKSDNAVKNCCIEEGVV
ncbi:MAG: transporter related [Clostridia bacterium]|nr:transporter related [Clostridia bacterium]